MWATLIGAIVNVATTVKKNDDETQAANAAKTKQDGEVADDANLKMVKTMTEGNEEGYVAKLGLDSLTKKGGGPVT